MLSISWRFRSRHRFGSWGLPSALGMERVMAPKDIYRGACSDCPDHAPRLGTRGGVPAAPRAPALLMRPPEGHTYVIANSVPHFAATPDRPRQRIRRGKRSG